jgi:hypothetical protein
VYTETGHVLAGRDASLTRVDRADSTHSSIHQRIETFGTCDVPTAKDVSGIGTGGVISMTPTHVYAYK